MGLFVTRLLPPHTVRLYRSRLLGGKLGFIESKSISFKLGNGRFVPEHSTTTGALSQCSHARITPARKSRMTLALISDCRKGTEGIARGTRSLTLLSYDLAVGSLFRH